MIEVTDIKGVGPAKAETLEENGYESVEDIAQADPDELGAVDGVGDDRALEFMMGAGDLLDAEQEVEDETDGDEFDLTPSEVGDELEEQAEVEEEDDSPEVEVVDENEEEEDDAVEDSSESEATYDVRIDFETNLQYDVYHAALMRHHERVYTSYQPASDAMQKAIDGLDDFTSVNYELTEFELNTLHTAVKQARSNYQGANLIDHMDALNLIEDQIDDQRREYLF